MSAPVHVGRLRSRWIFFPLAAVLVVAPAAAAAAALSATSTISWQPCHETFFCARVKVPLDYGDPAGKQISLKLIKHPATDPARLIGSLFVNPGGPGGSGVDEVLDAGDALFTP